ncbi:hypothetical protein Droror1_Dr00017691 [Drosera rotundifolia]
MNPSISPNPAAIKRPHRQQKSPSPSLNLICSRKSPSPPFFIAALSVISFSSNLNPPKIPSPPTIQIKPLPRPRPPTSFSDSPVRRRTPSEVDSVAFRIDFRRRAAAYWAVGEGCRRARARERFDLNGWRRRDFWRLFPLCNSTLSLRKHRRASPIPATTSPSHTAASPSLSRPPLWFPSFSLLYKDLENLPVSFPPPPSLVSSTLTESLTLRSQPSRELGFCNFGVKLMFVVWFGFRLPTAPSAYASASLGLRLCPHRGEWLFRQCYQAWRVLKKQCYEAVLPFLN